MLLDLLRTFSTGTQVHQKKTLTPKVGQNIVLVDGVRTPFLMSGTDYSKLMPHELAKQSLRYFPIHNFLINTIKQYSN